VIYGGAEGGGGIFFVCLFFAHRFVLSFFFLPTTGPGMSEKLRVLLTKFTKASVPEPKTERLSWLRTRTNRSKGSPTKRLSKRRARQKKVTLLRNCYGQQ